MTDQPTATGQQPRGFVWPSGGWGRFLWLLGHFKRNRIDPLRVRGKTKIFCVGLSKTGTTSLARAFTDLGYIVGHQKQAERLMPQYSRHQFGPIVHYCRTAQVFQDFPFFFLDTCQAVDRAFPGSKFILTVRDSPEQWYASLTGFLSKLFGNGQIPTAEDLRQARYVWPGWMREALRLLYGTQDHEILAREPLQARYVAYNKSIVDYFAGRPSDLLVINVADADAYPRFCAFLGIKSKRDRFPWENGTADIVVDSSGKPRS